MNRWLPVISIMLMASMLQVALPELGIKEKVDSKYKDTAAHQHSYFIYTKTSVNACYCKLKQQFHSDVFRHWWHCADVIVGNDKHRGVFILKALMTTALKSLLFASWWNNNNFYSLQSLCCLCLVNKRETFLIFRCLFSQVKVILSMITGTTQYIWNYSSLWIINEHMSTFMKH